MTPASGFFYDGDLLCADGVPVHEIAKTHGTPCYVYSAGQIRANIQTLKAALGPDILIAYACKANTSRAVLSLMAKNGLGADVVSGGELHRALKAGIPADKIVFSGVGKTDEEIKESIRHKIGQINIESGAELERLLAINPQQNIRVGFRLNPDVLAPTHAKIATGHGDSKFGMPADEIRTLYRSLRNHPTIRPTGLSVHVGSQLLRPEDFREGFLALASLAQELDVDALDLGGGLGIPYTDETPIDLNAYAALIRKIFGSPGKKLTIEPGRYLVGNAGILLTRVIDIKKTPHRPIIIVDAGMNDLMRPALYEAVHTMQPATATVRDSRALFDVVGPVCESSDIFLRGCMLPPPARGDVMALMNAGAYGFSMASTYNSRPLLAEIMTANGTHALIRPRQSLDALCVGETELPEGMAA